MSAYNSNAERFFILDPLNEDHLRLLEEFQVENNINVSNCFKTDENPNEENIYLFIEESSKMRDFCHIHGYKDLKQCSIRIAPIETKRKRKLISYATNYAHNILKMKEVFVMIPLNAESLAMNMEVEGYESIGKQDGNLVFLKEHPDVISQQMCA